MKRRAIRAVAASLLVTLIANPLFGSINGTLAAAAVLPADATHAILQLLLDDDPLPEPSIAAAPAAVSAGGIVTLTGSNLNQATGLFLNGVELFILSRTSGSLTASVPAAPGTGFLTVLSANGRQTQTAHAIAVSAPPAPAVTYRYDHDALGNVIRITDSLNRITDRTYDALNRLQQELQPPPNPGGTRPLIQYAYDGLHQSAATTDPRGLTTEYAVDGLGNQTALTSPDTGAGGKTFDEAGNIKTSTDARGKTVAYTHDALNRLTRIAYASGTATVFEYDGGPNGLVSARGHLSAFSDESGETRYVYGGIGHLLDKAHGIGSGADRQTFHVNYTYGASGAANGKLTALTYPSGNQVNFHYDSAGRVAAMSLHPANGAQLPDTGRTIALLSDIGYHALGAPVRWAWGNHRPASPNTYARTVDSEGRLASYPLGTGTAGGLNRIVTYDAAGRIRAMHHGGSTAPADFDQTFDYDDLDRLTGFTTNRPADGQRFQYDLSGNRTQAAIGNAAYSYTVAPASNRLSAVGGSVAKAYAFDAAGNLTGDGAAVYAYGDHGRMQSVTAGGNTVRYLYNGLGQRVQKSGSPAVVPGGRIRFVYDEQGHLLGEYDVYGQAIQETVYLGDQPVAVLKQTVTNGVSDTQIYYVFADHLNTPRVITRATDNRIVWRWDSDPFGTTAANENPSGLGAFSYNPRFPGQYFDRESGLHYNYYRDYDPGTGRYVESDPIGLKGGINTYSYVGGNSVGGIDPLGLYSWSDVNAAWDHYCDGTGTPWSTSFSSINWGDASSRIGEKIKSMVGNSCKNRIISINFDIGGQAEGADKYIIGRHSLRAMGTIKLNCDCSWTFTGTMSSVRGFDPYDFNSSNRGGLGEALTWIGRNRCSKSATPFNINLPGFQTLSFNGKVEGATSCDCR